MKGDGIMKEQVLDETAKGDIKEQVMELLRDAPQMVAIVHGSHKILVISEESLQVPNVIFDRVVSIRDNHFEELAIA